VGGARAGHVTFRRRASGEGGDKVLYEWIGLDVDKIRDVRGYQVFAGEGDCRSLSSRWSELDSVEINDMWLRMHRMHWDQRFPVEPPEA
jgi:hypothetical protein